MTQRRAIPVDDLYTVGIPLARNGISHKRHSGKESVLIQFAI
ncbi:hypothetical protein [Xenorhabdus szentirmaii]|nr:MULTISPECIES: hypothetical protein [Xenorhabdus]